MTAPTIRSRDQYGNMIENREGENNRVKGVGHGDEDDRIIDDGWDDCDYRRVPSFVSRADPERLEKIFAKAVDAGRLSRWRIASMEKRIADAKAEARTMNPLFKQMVDK